MKTIRLVVELINVPDECTAEKFRTKLEEGEFPSCIADNFGIVAANMADKNIEDLDNFQFTIYSFPEDEEDEFDDDEGFFLDTLIGKTNGYRIKPEPKYRPFANAEECWAEMLEHQPIGWVKTDEGYEQIWHVNEGDDFNSTFKYCTFADGTPFGVKTEE